MKKENKDIIQVKHISIVTQSVCHLYQTSQTGKFRMFFRACTMFGLAVAFCRPEFPQCAGLSSEATGTKT